MDQVIKRNVQLLQDSALDNSRRVWVVINVQDSKGITAFHLRNTRPRSFHRVMKLVWKALVANVEEPRKKDKTQ